MTPALDSNTGRLLPSGKKALSLEMWHLLRIIFFPFYAAHLYLPPTLTVRELLMFFKNVILGVGLTFWLWVISCDVLMRFFQFNGSLESRQNIFGFSKQLRMWYLKICVGYVKDVQNPISTWTQFLNKAICCW